MAFQGSSSSSSSTGRWTYEVFLSFRGEDTRHNFTSHLYQNLLQKEINTFIDDEELRSGEKISSSLLKAIEQSRISIVVLSQTYASSGWCLDELLKILECKETKGQIVLPVFYKVDPSDVRHQKNSFETSLAKHEERFKNDIKVQRWKAALTQVANLSGWHLENYRNEAKFIEKIVQKISRIVNHTYLHVAKHPVVIESRVQKISSLLSIEINDKRRMVGILGAGGIGKTTVAKAIYNLIASQFEGSCFLANVRETSKQYSGLVQLQNTLLSNILGHTVKVDNAYQGIAVIKRRLCSKMILLILDDVDDQLDQLDKLAGNVDWFGLGSRIIITTRDKKVLTNHGIDDDLIYMVEQLGSTEASELFCQNAFKEGKPSEDFLELVEDAIRYAGGIPLALEVLGSHLYGKDIHQWKSALDKYKRIPPESIQETLRISYDGLHENEKNIFLDIACFFKGKPANYVIEVLNSCDLFPLDGIKVLIQKSLITIDEDNKLAMHSLLQDMGREVVRRESPENPGKRSRLWFHKDVRHVLEENTGTITIQGILVDFPEGDMVHLSSKAFKNMKMLRLLIVNPSVCFSRGPIFLPNELTVLDWPNCPLESFPSNFHGAKLVVLRMPGSLLKELKGVENFRSTTIMNFMSCKFLKMTTDFSRIPNLRELILDSCTNLVEIDHSIGFLDKLVWLSLDLCYNLSSFPRNLKLRSLKYLKLGGCKRLNNFPEIECEMECLKCINLFGSGIKELHSSIRYLIALERLDLEGCKNLMNLPSCIYMLPHLDHLNLKGCSKLVKFPEKMGDNKQSMPSAVSKKELEISSCLELLPLPPPTNSSSVSNDGSSSIVFPALRRLWLANCVLLESNIFRIFNCSSTLEDLDLSGTAIVTIPACIKRFVRLRRLNLDNCKKLREILELPPNIENVFARWCMSLKTFFEEPQRSQLFNTWCLRKHSAPSLVGSGIELEGSSANNITPDGKAHFGVDVSTAICQNVQTLQTPQPSREHLKRHYFSFIISGYKIPHWFNYHKEVSYRNSCEIDIDEPADFDGEITGIAFSVVVTGVDHGKICFLKISASIISGGVEIYRGDASYNILNSDFVWLHFHYPKSFKITIICESGFIAR